jgi:AcrR family transcriptional regulator
MARSVPGVPKSQERIAQEREFRRGRIADEAMKLFAEHGFSAVSVEQIAEASGYTRVSVYNHFRGKPLIYLYIIERETERLAREIERAIRPEMSAVESFHAFLECLIAQQERQPSFFDLYFLEREQVQRDMTPDEVASLEEAQFRIERIARGIFERAVNEGACTDIDAPTATNLFFIGFAGAILLHRTHRFKASLRQLLQGVGHYFLRSLGAAQGKYALPFHRELQTSPGGSRRRKSR